MTGQIYRGIFVAEGTSDLPLADIVEAMFLHRGANLSLSRPDFSLLPTVNAWTSWWCTAMPTAPARGREETRSATPSPRLASAGRSSRTGLALPRRHEVEGVHDPRAALRQALLDAANVTGRRRVRLDHRFSENRRQLLERLDPTGPLSLLPSWQDVTSAVDAVLSAWRRHRHRE